MTQLKDGGRQPSNREERSLSASTVIARWQGNGEPCKSRGGSVGGWRGNSSGRPGGLEPQTGQKCLTEAFDQPVTQSAFSRCATAINSCRFGLLDQGASWL